MVVIKNPNEYIFVKFRKSNRKHKKYDAILKHRHTGRQRTVSFGDVRYEHFKDSTGIGAWSHKDHGDAKRRKSYRQRHSATARSKYSSSWFAYHYLW